MSDRPTSTNRRGGSTDRGMTLPELLIAVTIMGLIIAVVSSAVIVTLTTKSSSEGRFNVARAEQNVGMWLPADLASAATVNTDPAATPCGTDACPDFGLGPGSNALLISWSIQNQGSGTPTYTYTNVSYFFSQTPDGTFMLTRIECINAGSGWNCSTARVLSDLPGPPGGELWEPGVTRPSWVIQVSQPLAADATDESQVVVGDSGTKNARRVVVTVNGGGETDGAGGGSNTISITAGGTTRNVIDAQSVQGAPSFVEAKSLCGGPMTLIVDESQSITSTYIGTVRAGVRDFVEALAGTPVKLQIVPFNDRARALGTNAENPWHRYFDMTDLAQVNELRNLVNTQVQIGGGGGSGYTNWEDAMFRTFRSADASTPQVVPEKVVFFTDGVPNRDRQLASFRNGVLPAEPAAPAPGWGATNTGTAYNQVAYNRANYYATWARSSVTMVGVAVGPDVSSNSTWVTNPGAGYHLTWERGSRTYQKAGSFSAHWARYWTRTTNTSNTWTPVTKAVFDAQTNTQRKRDQGTSTSNWTNPYNGNNPSSSQFAANNSTADTSDGWYRSGPGSWAWISTEEYLAAQGTKDADAYRSQAKQWAAGPDWEPVSTGGSTSDYRSTKVYAPPYEAYDALQGSSVKNDVIIGRIVAGGDNFTRAEWDGSKYTNVAEANLYSSTNWGQLGIALKTIALGECGGTLTLQTRLNGSPASDPFSYQNSAQFNAAGQELSIAKSVVRTNRQFTTGTFSFDVADGLYHDVVILPENLSDLGSYSPGGWVCRAGIDDRTFELVNIPGAESSPWKGIKVRVGANEAVSCTQTVLK